MTSLLGDTQLCWQDHELPDVADGEVRVEADDLAQALRVHCPCYVRVAGVADDVPGTDNAQSGGWLLCRRAGHRHVSLEGMDGVTTNISQAELKAGWLGLRWRAAVR